MGGKAADSYVTNAGRNKLRDSEAFVARLSHFKPSPNPSRSRSRSPNPNPNPNPTWCATSRATWLGLGLGSNPEPNRHPNQVRHFAGDVCYISAVAQAKAEP